jgi:hypothetical protein
VRELARVRDIEYVDLPTGQWPQFTRPEELGRAILASIDPRRTGDHPQRQGRYWPCTTVRSA